MPTAGTFVADNADVGQTGTVAAAAAEGLDRAWWDSFAVPSPVPFLLKGSLVVVFKRGDYMLMGATPVLN